MTKSLEENRRVNLHDFGFGKGFLDLKPKAQATKQQTSWNSSKLKTFVHHKTPSRK